MGLLDFLKPTTKAFNRNLFAFLLANTPPDWTTVERLEAYKGWVYACINAIAQEVSTIDLQLERKTRDGWEIVEDHIALGPLTTVNPVMNFSELVFATVAYTELDGNAFWYVVPGEVVKKPIAFWPLDPSRVTIVKHPKEFVGGYVYKNDRGVDVPLKKEEVIHFKTFNPRNPYRGLGTVQAAALAIDTDVYAATYNRNFFYNSAVPSAVLETDGTMEQEDLNRLRAQWEAKYRGVDNAHKTAVLTGGLKLKPASLSQKDMEYLEARRWNRDEILSIFRVPKALLGQAEDFNRANIDGIQTIFARYVVKPRMQFIADRLTEFYLPQFGLNQGLKQEYRFTFTDPVPENNELKLTERKTALGGASWRTINEIRAEDALDPIDGGDTVLVPGTLKTMDQVLNPPDPMPTGGTTPPAAKQVKSATKEHAQVAGRVRFLTTMIKTTAPRYEEIFSQQNDALVKKLGGKAKAVKRLKDLDVDQLERANDLVRFLFDDWGDWIGVLHAPTRDTMQAALDFGGKQALASLDTDIAFDQLNPKVLEWLNTFSLSHATSINDTIKDEVTLRLMEGVEQGQGADEIAASIGEFFDEQSKWRAMRIARTEVISAYAEGSLAGYRQSGIVQRKQWLTAGDERVDPECALNQDQGAIALESPFATGHVVPPTHPNCRCVLQPVVD